MAMSALTAMLSECQFNHLTDPDNYQNQTYSPPAQYRPCPGDCSGNGDCLDGGCQCAQGFEEEDCSVDFRLPPSFTGISGYVFNIHCLLQCNCFMGRLSMLHKCDYKSRGTIIYIYMIRERLCAKEYGLHFIKLIL